MNNKALVLGMNYYIGLSVVRNLKLHGVTTVGVDYNMSKAYAIHSKAVDEILEIPHYDYEAQACCDTLVAYAQKQTSKPVLYPCADQYVSFISQFYDILKKYFLFQYESPTLANELMNKDSFSAIAKQHGMLIPLTLRMDDPDLEKHVEAIGYPWIIKGVDSPAYVKAFRVKLHQVNNQQELQAQLSVCKAKNIQAIIQQKIIGFDDHMVTYDAYLSANHQVTHAVTCQKLRQYPINYGASVLTTIVYNPNLHKIGKEFLEAIQWTGFAELEFKIDEKTKKIYLIEMNVRTTNFNHMLSHVGLNFPYINYCELTKIPTEPLTIKKDIHVAFVYGYENALAFKDYTKSGQMNLKRLLAPYHYKKVYAIFSFADHKPWVSFIGQLLKKITKKVRRKP
jgi:D-aspartate ligase